MTLLSADQKNKQRSDGHKADFFLSVAKPAVLLTAQVQGAHTRGATTITVDNGTSIDLARLRQYQTVKVVAGGDTFDVGLVSASLSGSSPSINGTITVDPNSIPWPDNGPVTIYEAFEPRVIQPTFDAETGVSTKRGQEFSGQTLTPGPVAGPTLHLAGFLTGATKTFDIKGFGTPTAQGTSISSWLWSATGGNIASPASQNTTIEFDATGQYWHFLRATDSNSKADTGMRHIWVHSPDPDDPDYPYVNFSFSPPTITVDGSMRTTITVHGVADQTAITDGALVMIWKRTWYGDTEELISLIDNDFGILFVGYIVKDTVSQSWQHGPVQFEAQAVTDIAKMLPMQALSIHAEAAVTYWFQMGLKMNLIRMLYWLLYWHSNLLQVATWTFPDSDLWKKLFKFNEGSIYAQALDIASKLVCHIGVNKAGQVFAEENIQFLDEAARAAIDVVSEITAADWREILVIPRKHKRDVPQAYVSGFHFDAGSKITPYCSIAPSKIREQAGASRAGGDGFILENQAHADLLSGRFLAVPNEEIEEIRVKFAGDYSVIDVFPQRWWTITLSASDTARGITLTDRRLKVISVTLTPDIANGVLLVDAVFQPEAFGPPGQADPCPTAGAPVNVSSPPHTSTANAPALLSFSSVEYYDENVGDWVEWDDAPALGGEIDPFWRQKQGTSDPSKALAWVPEAGAIERVSESGAPEVRQPFSDPPNIWSDSPAPEATDLDFVQSVSSVFVQDAHYALASWQNGTSEWRGWVAKTEDDGLTWTWAELYDGMTLPDEVRPLWMAANSDYVLITVWESTNGLKLLVFDTDLVYQDEFTLGAATAEEVEARTYYAFPVTVLDDADLWFVAGRMNAPQSLANPEQIISTDDAGANWSSVEDGWGADHCAALAVGLDDGGDRDYWAVRKGEGSSLEPSAYTFDNTISASHRHCTDGQYIYTVDVTGDDVARYDPVTDSETDILTESGTNLVDIVFFNGGVLLWSKGAGAADIVIRRWDIVAESWSTVYTELSVSPTTELSGFALTPTQAIFSVTAGDDVVIYSSDGINWSAGSFNDSGGASHEPKDATAEKHYTKETSYNIYQHFESSTPAERLYRWNTDEWLEVINNITYTYLFGDNMFHWRDNAGTFEYSSDAGTPTNWSTPTDTTITPVRSVNMPRSVGYKVNASDELEIYFWSDADEWTGAEVIVGGVVSAASILEAIRLDSGELWIKINKDGVQFWFVRDDIFPDSGGLTGGVCKFYSGQNGTLAERSDMDVCIDSPGALAVRNDGLVAAGNLEAAAVIVATASPDDNYAAWTDITGSHSGNPVKALKWINGT